MAAAVSASAPAATDAPRSLAAVSRAASSASFEWPASTRVSYVLEGNYRGEVHGNAQVEWIRATPDRYQVNLDVTVGLPFAPLLSRRMTSEGRLTPEGLYPERFAQDSKMAFSDRYRLSMRFEPDVVVLHSGRRVHRPPGLQDTTSQFIQLSFVFALKPELLTPGASIEVPLALPRRIDRWIYDVVGHETIATPFGAIDTVHLKPRRVLQPTSNELTAEIWYAPTLRYLPVRIKIRQDADTWLDLVIQRKPQLAAP